MRAFLSYAHEDMHIVDLVARKLGAAATMYDQESFDKGNPISAEIFRALNASTIFVLFWSKHAISSSYMQAEIRIALENSFKGTIKNILIFFLDDTSLETLPKELHSYIVEYNANPSQIARKIRSRLIEHELKGDGESSIFIGRDNELRELRRVLTQPSGEMHTTVSISGWDGIFDRLFVKYIQLSNNFTQSLHYLRMIPSRIFIASSLMRSSDIQRLVLNGRTR
ncbi:MAG: toll/interleukin-1 receptor domain-containing protein [Deltaproteobacteria bacterium]|nr:MAG: toll/interleukin-1 receptor domain-containing protein [Deltaproteobacteria bacterium]